MHQFDQLLPFLADFCNRIDQQDTLGRLAQLICEIVANAELDDCVVYLAQPERNELVQIAAIGQKRNPDGGIDNPIRLKFGQGIVGMVALFKKDIVIDDTSLTPNYVVDDCRRYSELTVPILYQGELLGVIDSENSSRHFFDAFHRALFQLLATTVAPAWRTMRESYCVQTMDNSALDDSPRISRLSSVSRLASKNTDIEDPRFQNQFAALLSTLNSERFQNIVIGLLKNFHKPNALSELPQLKNILEEYQDQNFSSYLIDRLKRSIRNACDELFLPSPKTQKFHFILEHTYFTPMPNHQAVSDHLGMSYSSFNRHLGKARREVSAFLWVKLRKKNQLTLKVG